MRFKNRPFARGQPLVPFGSFAATASHGRWCCLRCSCLLVRLGLGRSYKAMEPNGARMIYDLESGFHSQYGA